MNYLNMKLLYEALVEYNCNYFSMMSSSINPNGSMCIDNLNQLVLYAHQFGGILKDKKIKKYTFNFLKDLFEERIDFTYCSLLKFKECTDEYISFNIRCKTVLDYIYNKKQHIHFNIIINKNGTYNFLMINSIDE